MNKKIKKVNKVSAVQKALENLRKYIDESNISVLPSEDEIANALGVSRLTLRESITILEKEGLVSRIQGKGTLINSFVTKLDNRIDSGSDVEGALRRHGHEVKFNVVNLYYKAANEYEKLQMQIEENNNDEILVIEKVLYASDEPVALYIDRIPVKNLKTDFKFNNEYFEPTIFPIVEKICDLSITHDVVKIIPFSCDEELSKVFNLKVNTPLITFDVLEYTRDGVVAMYNTEYYTGKMIDFTICRNVAYRYNY